MVRTTTGNRVFGVLKGACDGGINVPHEETRFPGFTVAEEDGKDEYKPAEHVNRIFGKHVDTYMTLLKKAGADAYKK